MPAKQCVGVALEHTTSSNAGTFLPIKLQPSLFRHRPRSRSTFWIEIVPIGGKIM